MFVSSIEEGRSPARLWLSWRAAIIEQCHRLRLCGWTYLLIPVVIAVEAWLIGLDMAFRYAVLDGTELPNWFNLAEDRGLGEWFEYTMTGSGGLAMAWLALRRRSLGIALVAAVLALVTIDNSFGLHEMAGEWGASFVPAIGPLDGESLAELGFMGILGTLCLAGLSKCLLGRPSPALAGGATVIAVIVVAAIFGVGIDAVHAASVTGTLFEVVIAGVEDGGEMLCFTQAGALAILLLVADRKDTGARIPRLSEV